MQLPDPGLADFGLSRHRVEDELVGAKVVFNRQPDLLALTGKGRFPRRGLGGDRLPRSTS